MQSITKQKALKLIDDDALYVLDMELYHLYNTDSRFDRQVTEKYFLDDAGSVWLKVYWDDEEVYELRL